VTKEHEDKVIALRNQGISYQNI